MAFWDFLKIRFGSGSIPVSGEDLDAALASMTNEIYIRELAFWTTATLISKCISKCEFKTYIDGKENKSDEYYLWNVEPNINQNSSEFIGKWITTLLRQNEVLIIPYRNQLLVADSFYINEFALKPDEFSSVTVKGFTFPQTFYQQDVLYWKYADKNIRNILNSLYTSYSKLIFYSMKSYQKSRGTKGVFNYGTIPTAGTDQRKAFDALINEKFKTYLEADSAVLPLGGGQTFEEKASTTYSNESSRDIRALFDDIFDFTAIGFHVPPCLVTGKVQDTSKATDQLLTFAIDPLVDMLQEEINRKRYGKSKVLSGSRLQIDTKAIKHVDLLSVATSIDKIISSGSFCINDIRKLVGEEPIDEPWANQYFMTKNYATVEDILKNLAERSEEIENLGN